MVHALSAILVVAAFGARPWLDDFHQLTAAMSAHKLLRALSRR